MASAPNLTIAQCKEVFGVSHVALFNWTEKHDFPGLGQRTPGNLSRWAKKVGKKIVRQPLDVLHGKRAKKATVALKRTATGKLTSIANKKPRK